MQLCSVVSHLSLVSRHCHRTCIVLRLELGGKSHKSQQINLKLLHSSAVHFLRKPPQSRNTIFGIPITFIPWPSQMIRYAIRKRTHPHMFGKDEDVRRNIFHRLSLVYALLVWTGVGLVFYWFINHRKEDDKLDQKSNIPYQEEIDRGGAFYWITTLKGRNDIPDDQDIYVYKVKGLGFEKENVGNKVRVVTEHYRKEVEAKSDNILLRHRLGLPLEREEGGVPDEELQAAVEGLGKDYELEMDFLQQQTRRKQFDDRTDEELKALDTFDGKVKLYIRNLRRRIKKFLIQDNSENKSEEVDTDEVEVVSQNEQNVLA